MSERRERLLVPVPDTCASSAASVGPPSTNWSSVGNSSRSISAAAGLSRPNPCRVRGTARSRDAGSDERTQRTAQLTQARRALAA